MLNCSVCFQEYKTPLNLPCGCQFCSDCLTDWLLSQISETHFAHSLTASCLSQACRKPFHPREILEQLDSQKQAAINDALLKVYMKNSVDTRMCPNPKCSNGGVIDIKTSCRGNLTCESCGQHWREKVHETHLEKVRNAVYQLSASSSEFRSGMWVEFFTNSCPSCGISIYKNGGCKHMTCRACKYEFCWYCKGKHHGHNQGICDSAIFSKLWLTIGLIFHILSITGALRFTIHAVWFIMKCAVKFVFYNSMVFLPILWIFWIIDQQRRRRSIMPCFIVGVIVSFLYLMAFIWWGLVSDGMVFAKVEFYFILLGGGIVVCLSLLKKVFSVCKRNSYAHRMR